MATPLEVARELEAQRAWKVQVIDWTNKQMWFNIIFLILGILTAIAHYFGYGEWEPTEDIQQILFVVVMFINIILRYIATRPVALR